MPIVCLHSGFIPSWDHDRIHLSIHFIFTPFSISLPSSNCHCAKREVHPGQVSPWHWDKWDRKPFTLSVTIDDNLKLFVNLTAGFWSVGWNLSIEKPRHHLETLLKAKDAKQAIYLIFCHGMVNRLYTPITQFPSTHKKDITYTIQLKNIFLLNLLVTLSTLFHIAQYRLELYEGILVYMIFKYGDSI